MAGFHQQVAQDTKGVSFASAGQSEGQDVDATLYEAAPGQTIQLPSHSQGHLTENRRQSATLRADMKNIHLVMLCQLRGVLHAHEKRVHRRGKDTNRQVRKMLNRSTKIQAGEQIPQIIRGYATWRCPNGHLTEVWLHFDGLHAYGGSAWDFCDHCGERPDPVQDTKAHLTIYSKWLGEGEITLETYRAMARATVQTPYTPEHAKTPVGFLGLPSWNRPQLGATTR